METDSKWSMCVYVCVYRWTLLYLFCYAYIDFSLQRMIVYVCMPIQCIHTYIQCVYMRTFVCIYIHAFIHTCTHTLHREVHVCAPVNMMEDLYTCTYMCIYSMRCVHMFMYVHLYICTHTFRLCVPMLPRLTVLDEPFTSINICTRTYVHNVSDFL